MISVIIPVYNAEEYLEQCVDSVLCQTFTDFEVLLVNDGSTDNSGALCDKIVDRDGRIKVFHKQNGGQNSAIKHALKHAKGELVCFVDSDDWVEPDMLEKLYSYMNKYPCDCVVANSYRNAKEQTELSLHGYNKGFYDKERLVAEVFPCLFVETKECRHLEPSRCAKLFSRQKLLNVLKYCEEDFKYGEDQLLVYPYLLSSDGVCFIDDKVYHYRENQKSITYHFNPQRFEEQKKIVSTLRCAARELTNYNFNEQFEKKVVEIVNYELSTLCNIFLLEDRDLAKSVFKKIAKDKDIPRNARPYARTKMERIKYFLINHRCANVLWLCYKIKLLKEKRH